MQTFHFLLIFIIFSVNATRFTPITAPCTVIVLPDLILKFFHVRKVDKISRISYLILKCSFYKHLHFFVHCHARIFLTTFILCFNTVSLIARKYMKRLSWHNLICYPCFWGLG